MDTSLKLSVLIPTLPSRETYLAKLFKQITLQLGPFGEVKQIRGDKYLLEFYPFGEVEVITCLDNKKHSVGHKRNILKGNANGKYFCFVDDDDRISGDYFEKLLPLCDGVTDLITFRAIMYQSGRPLFDVHYDPKYQKDYETPAPLARIPPELQGRKMMNGRRAKRQGLPVAHRMPNHLMVWRKDLVRGIDFPKINLGEDNAWAKRIRTRPKKVQKLEDILYFYMYEPGNTETQR